MGKRYNHLSYEERVKIEHWHEKDKSVRFMARELGRSPNTISYELQHLRVSGEYLAKKASVKAYQKRWLARTMTLFVRALPPAKLGRTMFVNECNKHGSCCWRSFWAAPVE